MTKAKDPQLRTEFGKRGRVPRPGIAPAEPPADLRRHVILGLALLAALAMIAAWLAF